jgi:hypothetical protein
MAQRLSQALNIPAKGLAFVSESDYPYYIDLFDDLQGFFSNYQDPAQG